jgi:hypothetical protein
MLGTRPQGWLFNLLARKPQGVPYQVIEAIQPVIEAGLDWPLDLQLTQVVQATGAGGQIDLSWVVPLGKHRVYVGGYWLADTIGCYQPAAVNTFTAWVGSPVSTGLGHQLTMHKLQLGNGYGVGDRMATLGKQSFWLGFPNAGATNTHGSVGNVYVGPQCTLFHRWTGQPGAANITVGLLYIERDSSVPMTALL